MRLLPWLDAGVAQQLAWDYELLAAGGEVLRFWESPEVAVVLGKSNAVEEWVQEEACRRDGIPVLRRESGGGAVLLAAGCLNYSAVFSLDRRPGWRSVQASLEAILHPMAVAFGADFRPPGDIAIDERKVAGCAQRRTLSTLLHHGTLLYDFDAALAERYLRMPSRQPAYRKGRPHTAFLGNLPLTRQAIEQRVVAAWGAEPLQAVACSD